jgi:hypothetical protein
MHAVVLALAFSRYAFAAPLPMPPAPKLSLPATPTPTLMPSYTATLPTSVASPTPAPSLSARAPIGCTNGLLCPFRDWQGLDKLSFFVCGQPDSPACYASRSLDVVPGTWAYTATSGRRVVTSVPDFASWRSAMASRVSRAESVSSVSAASSRARFSATAMPGQSSEKSKEEKEKEHKIWQEETMGKYLNGGESSEGYQDLEPLIQAAYVENGSDSISDAGSGSSSDAKEQAKRQSNHVWDKFLALVRLQRRTDSTSIAAEPVAVTLESPVTSSVLPSAVVSSDSAPASSLVATKSDDLQSIASMRWGIKTHIARAVDEEFEEMMDGHLGDDWLNALEVTATASSDGVSSIVASGTSMPLTAEPMAVSSITSFVPSSPVAALPTPVQET